MCGLVRGAPRRASGSGWLGVDQVVRGMHDIGHLRSNRGRGGRCTSQQPRFCASIGASRSVVVRACGYAPRARVRGAGAAGEPRIASCGPGLCASGPESAGLGRRGLAGRTHRQSRAAVADRPAWTAISSAPTFQARRPEAGVRPAVDAGASGRPPGPSTARSAPEGQHGESRGSPLGPQRVCRLSAPDARPGAIGARFDDPAATGQGPPGHRHDAPHRHQPPAISRRDDAPHAAPPPPPPPPATGHRPAARIDSTSCATMSVTPVTSAGPAPHLLTRRQ
jgi:hypothetical protein